MNAFAHPLLLSLLLPLGAEAVPPFPPSLPPPAVVGGGLDPFPLEILPPGWVRRIDLRCGTRYHARFVQRGTPLRLALLEGAVVEVDPEAVVRETLVRAQTLGGRVWPGGVPPGWTQGGVQPSLGLALVRHPAPGSTLTLGVMGEGAGTGGEVLRRLPFRVHGVVEANRELVRRREIALEAGASLHLSAGDLLSPETRPSLHLSPHLALATAPGPTLHGRLTLLLPTALEAEGGIRPTRRWGFIASVFAPAAGSPVAVLGVRHHARALTFDAGVLLERSTEGGAPQRADEIRPPPGEGPGGLRAGPSTSPRLLFRLHLHP